MSAERWLDEYGGSMYRFALLRLGRRDAAEDVVQDALLAAAAAPPQQRSPGQERAWLFTILRNKTVDQIRREVRRRRAEARAAAIEMEGAPCGCHAEGIERRLEGVENEELRLALRKAIESLPDLMREAFCFRVLDELSTEDICKILEITPTNLWTLIHRAKRRLHVALGERFSDFSGGPGA